LSEYPYKLLFKKIIAIEAIVEENYSILHVPLLLPTMPTNHAAYLVEAEKNPLEVGEAPYPSPDPGTVVIKNHAVAINPVDWKLQDHADIPLKYPFILGEDAAGEVVEVGSGVTNVTKGQRVIGFV